MVTDKIKLSYFLKHSQSLLFIGPCSLLPVTASTHEGFTLTAYRITLIINIKLWQVSVWRLSVVVSDCKNMLEGIYRQALIPNKMFSKHKVWFLPNEHLYGQEDSFGPSTAPSSYDGVFLNFSLILVWFLYYFFVFRWSFNDSSQTDTPLLHGGCKILLLLQIQSKITQSTCPLRDGCTSGTGNFGMEGCINIIIRL